MKNKLLIFSILLVRLRSGRQSARPEANKLSRSSRSDMVRLLTPTRRRRSYLKIFIRCRCCIRRFTASTRRSIT